MPAFEMGYGRTLLRPCPLIVHAGPSSTAGQTSALYSLIRLAPLWATSAPQTAAGTGQATLGPQSKAHPRCRTAEGAPSRSWKAAWRM